MPIYYHITNKSSNRKTGPIPVITSSCKTCPDNCPFKKNGCYGNGGPLGLHWRKVSEGLEGYALTFDKLLERVQTAADKAKKQGVSRIRLWQAGDMPGLNKKINLSQVKRLVKTLKSFQMPFGYTHKLPTRENRKAIRYCNKRGVTINLSANNLRHADLLFKLNIGPVTVALPKNSPLKGIRTPEGRKVVICPAVISDNITCASCGGNKGPLCWRTNRNYIIGFPAHGSGARKVSATACEEKVKY
jgi:hypothetical protein